MVTGKKNTAGLQKKSEHQADAEPYRFRLACGLQDDGEDAWEASRRSETKGKGHNSVPELRRGTD